MAASDKIDFKHQGIGRALEYNRLVVPLNQREYSWEAEHVQELIEDLNNACFEGKSIYFLGTIVLNRGNDGRPEVTDGQQRLATTTILLAAVRDHLIANGLNTRADSIEQQFLLKVSRRTEELLPQLELNVDDNEFFKRYVLSRPGSADRNITPSRESHEHIKQASDLAIRFVASLKQVYGKHYLDRLNDWLDFIEERAQVILLTVPDDLDAFLMFETLNDRGLKASQADLLKSHILKLSGSSIKEAQQKWARMVGILETTHETEIVVSYLRHLFITLHGPTRERELFGRVKKMVSSKAKALSFADSLADSADDYVAIFQPDHSKWNAYGTTTKKHIKTLLDLDVQQIRPLLFAVAKHFSVKEGAKAFKMFVSWSVRFLIAGGRGGLLDRNYALRAHEVGTKKTTTCAELVKAMADVVPTDAAFEAAFADARVSKPTLARYYLRHLERFHTKLPETIPNDNEREVNLEHILPENPGPNWPGITADLAGAVYRRIGNQALLPVVVNSTIGNGAFAVKAAQFKNCGLKLTQEVADYSEWNATTIAERQAKLAKIAVKAWPIKP